MSAAPKWMFEPPTQPDSKTKRDPEAQHRAQCLYSAARAIAEQLAVLHANGGIESLRERVEPLVLAALDRQLATLETIAHDIINAPKWAGPHGRVDIRYRKIKKNLPRETHDWPIPADHPSVR